MNTKKRVFITGIGALTAGGNTAQDTWERVTAGQGALDEIKNFDISSWTHKLGGELKAFQPAKLLPDRKLAKVISRQDVMGINAAMQAVDDSQLIPYRDALPNPDVFNDETAVFVGSPGNKYYQQYDFLPLVAKTNGDMQAFATELFSEVHPMWLLRILPNNVLAYTGITYGFKGVNHNVTNHATGGMQALIEATHAIQSGKAQRAIVVAYDAGTEPQALFYYSKLGVVSANHLKPFDVAHDGTILAEGAAAIVLESEDSVAARNATCYAELLGGAARTEGAGLFSLEAEGRPLSALMTDVLKDKNLSAKDVAFIAAHGNGNQASDASEACAIAAVFGERTVPVTAYKWSMGHTLCASGILDTVLSTLALREGVIPGIGNFSESAPLCDGLNISNQSRAVGDRQKHAMVINRGFASMNACLLLKSCVE